MENKYHIKTIEELLSIVNKENVNNFIKDFSDWLIFRTTLPKTIMEGNVKIEAQNKEFCWIDDGKHNTEITVELMKDKTPPEEV